MAEATIGDIALSKQCQNTMLTFNLRAVTYTSIFKTFESNYIFPLVSKLLNDTILKRSYAVYDVLIFG